MDSSRSKTRDPDQWLETAPAFSRPITQQLREWFLKWEPDLSESVKWSLICFSGRKNVCGISPAKAHVSVAFFRGTELDDPAGLFDGGEENTNIRCVRIVSPGEVNAVALRALLRAAVALDGDAARPVAKQPRAPLPVPDYFATMLAMKKHRKAAENFSKLSPSCRREHIRWLTDAKREETRDRRMATLLEFLNAGRKWPEQKA